MASWYGFAGDDRESPITRAADQLSRLVAGLLFSAIFLTAVYGSAAVLPLSGVDNISNQTETASVPAGATVEPTFVSTTIDTTGQNVDNFTINTPGSIADGDVMIAHIVADKGSDTTITTPAGWTIIGSAVNNGTSIQSVIYFRVIPTASSEPTSHTWPMSPTVPFVAGAISAYRDVSTSSPIDANGAQINEGSPDITAPSITTTVDKTLLVGFFSDNDFEAITEPTAMAGRERYDFGETQLQVEGADVVQALAGSTGTQVATTQNADKSIGHLIALNPIGCTISGGIRCSIE